MVSAVNAMQLCNAFGVRKFNCVQQSTFAGGEAADIMLRQTNPQTKDCGLSSFQFTHLLCWLSFQDEPAVGVRLLELPTYPAATGSYHTQSTDSKMFLTGPTTI